MHELSIVMEVLKQVEKAAASHGSPKVNAIVLQVGEASSVVPRFLEECYEIASHNTPFKDTELQLEIIPAMGRCRNCEQIYHLRENQGICPRCDQSDAEFLSGREFMIKQIIVEDEHE